MVNHLVYTLHWHAETQSGYIELVQTLTRYGKNNQKLILRDESITVTCCHFSLRRVEVVESNCFEYLTRVYLHINNQMHFHYLLAVVAIQPLEKSYVTY